MFAIKAIYDGNCFKLAQPVPVVEEYEVIIAFTEPIKKTQTDILKYFNTWEQSDADAVIAAMETRDKFSYGRETL